MAGPHFPNAVLGLSQQFAKAVGLALRHSVTPLGGGQDYRTGDRERRLPDGTRSVYPGRPRCPFATLQPISLRVTYHRTFLAPEPHRNVRFC